MMEKFIIIGVFIMLFGFHLRGSNGQNPESLCMNLIHCNLLQGDLAREMDSHGKDSSKFYSTAEKNLDLYTKLNMTKSNNIKMECEKSYKKCITDAATMAVEFGFPAEYKTTCDFETYSRTIFFCKNVKEWPKQLWNVITPEFRQCTISCMIWGNGTYMLGNGQKVATLDDPGTIEEIGVSQEALQNRAGQTYLHADRSKNPSREVVAWIAGFNDQSNQIENGPWGDVDTCKDDSWVDSGSSVNASAGFDTYPQRHVDFLCQWIAAKGNSNNRLVSATAGYVTTWYNGSSQLIDGHRAPHLTPEGRYFQQRDLPACLTESGKPSFLVGVAFRMVDFRGLGKVIRSLSFLCGGNPIWRHYGLPTDPDSLILCPNQTAICALQTKLGILDGVDVLTNIRFGCCPGDPMHPEAFLSTEWQPITTTTTLAPTTTHGTVTSPPLTTQVPSLHCHPTDELRELVGQAVTTGTVEIQVKVILTGIGLRWSTRANHTAMNNLEFKRLTNGVPEKFYFENKLTPSPVTSFNWNTRPNDTAEGKNDDYVWKEYNPDLSNTVEFEVPPKSCAKFYRVVGRCDNWEAFPKNIYMQISSVVRTRRAIP